MNQFYSFRKQFIFLFTLGVGLCSGSKLFSQCGPIIENFNTVANKTAGFSGASGNPKEKFAFVPGKDGYLEFSKVVTATNRIVTTPTYLLANNARNLTFGFTLAGNVKVSNIQVFAIYSLNGFFTSALVYAGNLGTNDYTYTGHIAKICKSVPLPKGLTGGNLFRLQVILISNSGDGKANATIIFDDFRTTATNSQIVLPVTFLSITANHVAEGVQVTWKVADEIDVTHYEVEKSTDGANFTTIGQVLASGQASYSFTDPSVAAANSFYRVKNVDIDGKFKYSPIIKINAEGNSYSSMLRVYPIPAQNSITVQHRLMSTATIAVTSMDGRVVKMMHTDGASSNTAIDLTGVTPGMYMLRVTDEKGATESTKFVKQ